MANEKRLIDANALLLSEVKRCGSIPTIGTGYMNETGFKQILDQAPTVDAVEVVHGRWEWLGPNNLIPECMCGTCSACKVRSKYIVNTDLCPNCGAKMDGDGNGQCTVPHLPT